MFFVNHHFSTTTQNYLSNDIVLHFISSIPLVSLVTRFCWCFRFLVVAVVVLFRRAVREIAITERIYNKVRKKRT